MTTFTVADVEAAAERLTAEHQAVFESLMKLEDHLGRKLLEGAALEGVTHERRAEVRYGVATLWTLYETYRAAVVRVHAIRVRRSRPTRADLQEIEELVAGAATVALPNPDGSPEPLRSRLTLDELVVEFRTVYAGVCEVVSAVGRVRVELSPRIERCHELLSQAEALAADLGLAVGTDPAASVLPPLADRLETVRRTCLTDPLRLWAENTVDVAEVEQLTVQCERAYAELSTLEELRRHVQPRLDLVETTFTEAIRLHRQISDERHRAYVKIHGMPAPDLAVPWEDPPDSQLAAVRELCQHASWRRLAAELAALERDADATLQRARTELADASRPLRERDELRGRLGAYRAKAAALGRIEDLALGQLYQRARDLLWSAPCDLAIAAAVVAEYQSAVNATAAASGGER